ncbi:hypothetical protein V8C43DRAFT_274450 [Trichoderma afarasin]
MAMFVPWKLEAQPFVTRRCMGWRWRWRGSINSTQFKIHALQLLLLFHGLLRTATDCRRDGGIFFIIIFIIYYYFTVSIRYTAPNALRIAIRKTVGGSLPDSVITQRAVRYSSCRYGRLPLIG